MIATKEAQIAFVPHTFCSPILSVPPHLLFEPFQSSSLGSHFQAPHNMYLTKLSSTSSTRLMRARKLPVGGAEVICNKRIVGGLHQSSRPQHSVLQNIIKPIRYHAKQNKPVRKS